MVLPPGPARARGTPACGAAAPLTVSAPSGRPPGAAAMRGPAARLRPARNRATPPERGRPGRKEVPEPEADSVGAAGPSRDPGTAGYVARGTARYGAARPRTRGPAPGP